MKVKVIFQEHRSSEDLDLINNVEEDLKLTYKNSYKQKVFNTEDNKTETFNLIMNKFSCDYDVDKVITLRQFLNENINKELGLFATYENEGQSEIWCLFDEHPIYYTFYG